MILLTALKEVTATRPTAAEEGRLKEAGRAAQATGPGSGTVSVRTHASGAPTARKRTLWVLRAKGRRYPYREGTAQCVGPQLRLSPSLPCLALRPAEEHLKMNILLTLPTESAF